MCMLSLFSSLMGSQRVVLWDTSLNVLSCDMQDLAEHPFWNFSLPPRAMPEEPAFEAFITAHQLRPAAPVVQEGSFDQVIPVPKLQTLQSQDALRPSDPELHEQAS